MRTISVAAAALLAAQGVAHPVVSTEKHNRIERRMVDLNKFRLDTEPTYVSTVSIPSSISSINKRADYVSTATEAVKKVAPNAEFRVVDDSYVGKNGIAHVHFKQTAHGLDIDNADFNVNIGKGGTVFSYGSSFFKGDIPAASPLTKRDFVDPVAALKGVSDVLSLSVGTAGATAKPEGAKETYAIEGATRTHQAPQAKLVYFVKPDNTVALSWRVETDLYDDWLLSYIDAATSKKIQGVVNYKADAQYEVYPWGINDPDEGGREIISDPWDIKASEFTWQNDGTTTYTVTRGNNGIAQANYEGDSSYLNDYRPNSPNSSFTYPVDFTATDPKKNVDASVTQLWYTANMYHDLLYELGFTEEAGNFETNVDGQGGKGNDAVILNAQDGAGTDNADFSTPPDGQAGRMRMFIWDYTTPKRDCTFEAGVVIHEYTHGLSNRLTGGPANSACLNVLEAGGMGEGWGDFMATAIRTNTSDSRNTDFPLGAWVYGDPAGLRAYVYSTNIQTNPLTYKSLNQLNEVHAIGTMWANTLYEVMWNLIDEHGNTDAIRPQFDSSGIPTEGRYLTMKLVVDAMALQPCNPTMPQARDAIIDADQALTGGTNACLIWTAFAKRGLGENAARGTSTDRTEDYTIPSGVC